MTAISDMPAAAALAGTELVEVVQGGANVQTTTQDIADLATPGGVGGGGSETLLANLTYNPAVLDSSVVNTTAANYSPVDAVNILVTFTVPASGSVRHVIDAVVGGQNWNYIGLLSSTAAALPLTGSSRRFSLGTMTIPFHYDHVETGLTPSATVTRVLAGRVAGNSYTVYAGGDYGPLTWRVIAL